jgi:predicted DNA-binding transcriptional regulator AlpA
VEKLLGIAELCEAFSVSRGTFFHWRASSTFPLPAINQGRIVRWRVADVEAWLSNRPAGGISQGIAGHNQVIA